MCCGGGPSSLLFVRRCMHVRPLRQGERALFVCTRMCAASPCKRKRVYKFCFGATRRKVRRCSSDSEKEGARCSLQVQVQAQAHRPLARGRANLVAARHRGCESCSLLRDSNLQTHGECARERGGGKNRRILERLRLRSVGLL